MAKPPLMSVIFADEVRNVEVAGDRGIVIFDSLGASLRVSLSRKAKKSGSASISDLLIPFSGTGTKGGSGPTFREQGLSK